MRKRGIIIVDASSLQHLLGPVHKRFLSEDTLLQHDFTELLQTLSDVGYSIVIPEMVAYETARILPDGRTRNEILGRTDSKPDDPVLQHMRYAAGYFKTQIAERRPHIAIATPPENSEYESAVLMRALKQAADLPDKTRFEQIDSTIRAKHHLGDMAAIDCAATIPNPDQLPIFYLCEDRKARDALNDTVNPEAHLLTIAGMLDAMQGENILRSWPFKEDVMVEDIINEMRSRNAMRNAHKKGPRWITPLHAPLDRSDHNLEVNDRPFRQSLIGAEVELHPSDSKSETHHGKLRMRTTPPVKKSADWQARHGASPRKKTGEVEL